ncbi:hypothetical protein INR49_006028 [Caranx melampygus]|nr:hypothetical protein INR49_006028 [Caranx melampygus]
MRLRGLSWNVHRGQLLCITRSTRPRKLWAWCPPALLSMKESIPPDCPRREGSSAGCQAVRLWGGTEVVKAMEKAPLLHLGYCLQSQSRLRNVRNNTTPSLLIAKQAISPSPCSTSGLHSRWGIEKGKNVRMERWNAEKLGGSQTLQRFTFQSVVVLPSIGFKGELQLDTPGGRWLQSVIDLTMIKLSEAAGISVTQALSKGGPSPPDTFNQCRLW